jgi:hypothetical protein
MIAWSVELWSDDGDVIDYEVCDEWETVQDVVEEFSHVMGYDQTIAICIADDAEIDEDERWGLNDEA